MLRRAGIAVAVVAVLAVAVPAAQARVIRIGEFRLSAKKMETLRHHWLDQLRARYGVGHWAPLRFNLANRDLRLMGLPSKRVLTHHRYRVPTAVYPNGRMVRLSARNGKGGGGSSGSASGPGVVSYAGLGYFGIRPGAWLLLITKNSIGWCSMAHVYGSPGAYEISTAGHCGKVGDTGTVIGVVGNHPGVPVLIDFGKFVKSTDAGIGKDWALIGVYPAYQNLVTPTAAFWGGPRGIYTAQGQLAAVNWSGKFPWTPSVSVTPDPTLAQQIVHYGHGVVVGTGGTPRSGTAINWFSNYYTFFGAISPGDSGSYSNALVGQDPATNKGMEAAGINTHLYLEVPPFRTGMGYLAGTRATQVPATLANGQIVPYPAPTPAPLP